GSQPGAPVRPRPLLRSVTAGAPIAPAAAAARTRAGRARRPRPRKGGRRTVPARTALTGPAQAPSRGPPAPPTPPHPRRQRPQRKPDAEQVVHRADEKDGIVQERKGDQRQHRPVAVELAV